MTPEVRPRETAVLRRMPDVAYPNIERGEGVWLYAVDGREILDACSGGAGVACLGHGVRELADAAARQAGRISYVYNHHFTNQPQETLAERLLALAAPELARVRFVSGGSEANEAALRLARSYHVERGDEDRWRVVSATPSYHGATLGTLGLTGNAGLRSPYERYLTPQLHLGAKAWRSDPSGEVLLSELDLLLDEAGRDSVAAFVCEPVGGAALPGHSPPSRFWEGLAERRSEHGFLICLNEIITGIGRTGSWFAYQDLPLSAGHRDRGQGARGRVRAARCDPVPGARVRGDRPRARASSSTATPGTARRLHAPSASRRSTTSSSTTSLSGSPPAARCFSGRSSRPPPPLRSSARFAAAAI